MIRDETLASSPDLKILVADDSPVYRKLVEQALSQEGYTVLFAKNGRQAMDLFAEHRPALVITDWTMPDISGPDLCQRIRRDFQSFYAYVILLTANTDKEEVIEGLAAGADDYLTKPFHAGELQARVKVGRRIADLHHHCRPRIVSWKNWPSPTLSPAYPTAVRLTSGRPFN